MKKFGEIRIVLNQKLKKLSRKMDDKGMACMLTGYSFNH